VNLNAAVQNDEIPRGGVDAESASTQNGASTLDFLLRRMRNKSDFPALSESIARIQSMATSERESVSSVTNEILRDVALTNKLLRLVNSAHYARGNSVGTVSRAVSLVGFNGIRNLTLSLVLLEHMQDKGNAQLLKEEFLRALMAGAIAAELGASQVESEEAFIGALFQNLGRMLAQFYFAEEAATIRQRIGDATSPMSEDAAALSVLGLSYEQLGLGVSKAWGLPDSIQRCIVRPVGEPPAHRAKDSGTHLRWSAAVANDMANAMLHADPDVVDQQLSQLSRKHAKVLGVDADQIKAVTATARGKLSELADAMELRVPSHSPAARLLGPQSKGGDGEGAGSAGVASGPDSTTDVIAEAPLRATLDATAHENDSDYISAPRVVSPQEIAAQTMAAGIQDITNAMVEDFKLSDVLRMILEAMYRALGFHRVIFCLRDPKTNELTGRFGLGAEVESVVKSFCVALESKGPPDLFAAIVSKAADTLIHDTSDPRIAARLPLWYQRYFHAASFLILPLVIKGHPVGLIYADCATPGELSIDDKQLAMLRTLRNQAVMAFKQSA